VPNVMSSMCVSQLMHPKKQVKKEKKYSNSGVVCYAQVDVYFLLPSLRNTS